MTDDPYSIDGVDLELEALLGYFPGEDDITFDYEVAINKCQCCNERSVKYTSAPINLQYSLGQVIRSKISDDVAEDDIIKFAFYPKPDVIESYSAKLTKIYDTVCYSCKYKQQYEVNVGQCPACGKQHVTDLITYRESPLELIEDVNTHLSTMPHAVNIPFVALSSKSKNHHKVIIRDIHDDFCDRTCLANDPGGTIGEIVSMNGMIIGVRIEGGPGRIQTSGMANVIAGNQMLHYNNTGTNIIAGDVIADTSSLLNHTPGNIIVARDPHSLMDSNSEYII